MSNQGQDKKQASIQLPTHDAAPRDPMLAEAEVHVTQHRARDTIPASDVLTQMNSMISPTAGVREMKYVVLACCMQ